MHGHVDFVILFYFRMEIDIRPANLSISHRATGLKVLAGEFFAKVKPDGML